MWFDKYPSVPPRGSPLETVFVHVTVQRKDAELLSTRALVRSQWALLAKSPDAAKASFEAYEAYAESMFPFLEKAQGLATMDDNQKLLEHVKHPMQIDIQAIKRERAADTRARALQKFKMRKA